MSSKPEQLRNVSAQSISNYIFQGGSVKGIAYIGALDTLETKKDIKLERIKRIGGTSAGAITATLLSVGYDLEKLNKELKELKFEEFIDIENSDIKTKSLTLLSQYKIKFEPLVNDILSFKNLGFQIFQVMRELSNDFTTRIRKRDAALEVIKESTNYVVDKFNFGKIFTNSKIMDEANKISTKTDKNDLKDLIDVIKYAYGNKGLAEGNYMREWIEEKVKSETGIEHLTFEELSKLHEENPGKYKLLYLTGTNVNTKQSQIFSNEETPHVIISDAVRISMSIPIVFKPHQRYEKMKDKPRHLSGQDFYIDGGMLDNYPIWLCDKYNKHELETLGFRLVSLKQILAEKTNKFLDEYKTLDKEDLSNMRYLFSIIECLINKQESDYNLHEVPRKRTILINDCDVSMVNFKLDDTTKMKLIFSGVDAAEKYQIQMRAEIPSAEPEIPAELPAADNRNKWYTNPNFKFVIVGLGVLTITSVGVFYVCRDF